MSALGALIPYLVLVAVSVAFLWGSIVAMRGRRWWATVLMTSGSGLQLAGALLAGAGSLLMLMRMPSVTSSASAGSAAGIASAISPVIIVLAVGSLVLGLGFLLFTAGFVAFCGRYGSLERRAQELEGLVEGIQQRIE